MARKPKGWGTKTADQGACSSAAAKRVGFVSNETW